MDALTPVHDIDTQRFSQERVGVLGNDLVKGVKAHKYDVSGEICNQDLPANECRVQFLLERFASANARNGHAVESI